jgi:hypothetical protein
VNSATQLFGLIGAVISVCLAIGAGIALVRGSYSRARMQALREDNDDLRARMSDCEHVNEKLEAEVGHLTSENKLLTALVTQRADVDAVLEELRAHNQQAQEFWTATTQVMQKMATALEARS